MLVNRYNYLALLFAVTTIFPSPGGGNNNNNNNNKAGGLLLFAHAANDDINFSPFANSLRKRTLSTQEELLEEFEQSHTLDNTGDVQTVDNKGFMIDGEYVALNNSNDDDPFQQSKSGAARVYVQQSQQAAQDGDKIIVNVKPDGSLRRVVKVKSTGVIVMLESLDGGNEFVEYTSSDVNVDELSQYMYGDDLFGVDESRRKLLRDLAVVSGRAGPDPFQNQRGLQAACTEFITVRVSFHYDSGFCTSQGDDPAAAEDYIRMLVEVITTFYEVAGLCKRIEVCEVIGFCNGAGTDVYRDMVNAADEMCNIGAANPGVLNRFTEYIYPTNTFPGLLPAGQCDLAQMIYGRTASGGQPTAGSVIGCAWFENVCTSFAAGVNYFGFTSNMALHATLVAHEMGHNFAASHIEVDIDRWIMEPFLCDCTEFNPIAVDDMNAYLATRLDNPENCLELQSNSEPPSAAPSPSPSMVPSMNPSLQPSTTPSSTPSAVPSLSSAPSATPSNNPSSTPSVVPSLSSIPSQTPSSSPSSTPSSKPSPTPSTTPSDEPTRMPISTASPSTIPSTAPSSVPSSSPSESSLPSAAPITTPSSAPSGFPSPSPSATPSTTPSSTPSMTPSTSVPSSSPSSSPSVSPSSKPSSLPSTTPSTSFPSSTPSVLPSPMPSVLPSSLPSALPSLLPSAFPSKSPMPSATPSSLPTGGDGEMPIDCDEFHNKHTCHDAPGCYWDWHHYCCFEIERCSQVHDEDYCPDALGGNECEWVYGGCREIGACDYDSGYQCKSDDACIWEHGTCFPCPDTNDDVECSHYDRWWQCEEHAYNHCVWDHDECIPAECGDFDKWWKCEEALNGNCRFDFDEYECVERGTLAPSMSPLPSSTPTTSPSSFPTATFAPSGSPVASSCGDYEYKRTCRRDDACKWSKDLDRCLANDEPETCFEVESETDCSTFPYDTCVWENGECSEEEVQHHPGPGPFDDDDVCSSYPRRGKCQRDGRCRWEDGQCERKHGIIATECSDYFDRQLCNASLLRCDWNNGQCKDFECCYYDKRNKCQRDDSCYWDNGMCYDK